MWRLSTVKAVFQYYARSTRVAETATSEDVVGGVARQGTCLAVRNEVNGLDNRIRKFHHFSPLKGETL
jgi:hypothetical protein